MVEWWWILVAIVVTAALTLLAFGLLKAGSDCDDWHDGFVAGAGWKKEDDK